MTQTTRWVLLAGLVAACIIAISLRTGVSTTSTLFNIVQQQGVPNTVKAVGSGDTQSPAQVVSISGGGGQEAPSATVVTSKAKEAAETAIATQSAVVDVTFAPPAIATDGDYSKEFPMTIGYNPAAPQCKDQPNRTTIDPYKGCPVPGLNNVLYTQHNRWFCTYRDNVVLRLRDRICNKGTAEPFRFSTILQIDYSRIPAKKKGAAICWSDIKKQDEPRECSWTHIPKFYGTPLWWEARALIDFHPSYHQAAERFVKHKFGKEKFIGVHMRRGDYIHHCIKIQRKGIKPWIPFKGTKTLHRGMSSCFPNITEVEVALAKVKADHGAKYIFVGTNVPEELDPIKERLGIVLLADPERLGVGARRMDYLIFEMAIMARASAFVFNKYSSLSGTVYEMATVANRTTKENVYCW